MLAASEYAGQRETPVERSEVGGLTAAMIGSRSCFAMQLLLLLSMLKCILGLGIKTAIVLREEEMLFG